MSSFPIRSAVNQEWKEGFKATAIPQVTTGDSMERHIERERERERKREREGRKRGREGEREGRKRERGGERAR